MRFGAMAAEVRNNDSANFKEPCAAERVLEAATAAKPLPRCVQANAPTKIEDVNDEHTIKREMNCLI